MINGNDVSGLKGSLESMELNLSRKSRHMGVKSLLKQLIGMYSITMTWMKHFCRETFGILESSAMYRTCWRLSKCVNDFLTNFNPYVTSVNWVLFIMFHKIA